MVEKQPAVLEKPVRLVAETMADTQMRITTVMTDQEASEAGSDREDDAGAEDRGPQGGPENEAQKTGPCGDRGDPGERRP